MPEVSLYEKLNDNAVANTYWSEWGQVAEDSTLLSHSNKPRLAAAFVRPTLDSRNVFIAALSGNGAGSYFGEFADGATLDYSLSPSLSDITAADYPYAPPGSVVDNDAYKLNAPEFGDLVTLDYSVPGKTAGSAGSAPGDFDASTPLSPNWGYYKSVGGETV